MRLTAAEKAVAARVLNAMLKASRDGALLQHVLHPNNGQFDAYPEEAARSFVCAFAVKHDLHKAGVKVPDPSGYR